jgi:hypothetical protein
MEALSSKKLAKRELNAEDNRSGNDEGLGTPQGLREDPMEKLPAITPSRPLPMPPPVVDSAAAALARRIELAVRRGSGGRIHKLRVEVHLGHVILSGFCSTFYAKQLAQHSAMPLSEGRRLENQIEVW